LQYLPEFLIPQQEYALAWESSPAGKKDGRKLSEVTDTLEKKPDSQSLLHLQIDFPW